VSQTSRSEQETRFYRERLALLYRVGFFVGLGTFLVGVTAQGVVTGDVGAMLHKGEHLPNLAATALSAGLWWWFARPAPRRGALVFEDGLSLLFVCLLFDLGSALHDDRVVAAFDLALVTGLLVLVRAVLVPTTALCTVSIGLVLSAGATALFVLSGLPSWPVRQFLRPDWPAGLHGVYFGTWLAALVAIATIVSRVLHQLRSDVKANRQLGQYVLAEKLGEGGMGVVYRATHALLRRETALKLLPPDRVGSEAIRRFEREVVETARLRHPNTVAIYDYGRTPDGVFYYAMEYLDGLTLAELVGREGPLPAGRAVWLLQQVCASLEEAHGMGLVHRDIKPQNVMVVGRATGFDLVKVLDFGLVKTAAPLDGASSLTHADQVTGTPLYMAPEAIAKPDAAGPQSDLYAVAALGYFLLTGRHVFEGGSAVEIYAAHLHTPPVPPHERVGRAVPPDLEELVLRGLSKSPRDRPPGARAFRDLLVRCAVPRWTEDDARAWWRSHGEPAPRRAAPAPDVEYETITVMRDRAAIG
jgi:serine/threonine-protein kinase